MKKNLDLKLIDKMLIIIGIIFIIYGIDVLIIIGGARIFNYFYFVVGILVLLLTYINRKYKEKIANWIKVVFKICLSIFLISFITIESFVIYYGFSKPKSDADYLIVLGAGVKTSGITLDFKARLDGGLEYLIENTNTICITTGGQGKSEPVTEGYAGKEYLVSHGIDSDRILIEENSYNTNQNLSNAYSIIGDNAKDASIVIVSANYHLFRARFLAKKIGYTNVSLKGTRGLFILEPHYFTREYFGFMKDFLVSRWF